ncbi:MAG: hypothetical protein JWS12_391 [Candidatus Saccharibacteria bacterium]|nr:hypothetical protein [Candidatus Saccharibacteria bacterium]
MELVTIGKDKNTAAYVKGSQNPQSIFVDLNRIWGIDIEHELSHLIDFKECSYWGASRDNQLASLNPGNIYKHSSKYMSTDAIETMAHKIPRSVRHSRRNRERIDALYSRAVTRTSYSFTNELEDKAELGASYLLSGRYVFNNNKITSPLDKKTVLWAARLHHLDPNVFKFLIEPI